MTKHMVDTCMFIYAIGNIITFAVLFGIYYIGKAYYTDILQELPNCINWLGTKKSRSALTQIQMKFDGVWGSQRGGGYFIAQSYLK